MEFFSSSKTDENLVRAGNRGICQSWGTSMVKRNWCQSSERNFVLGLVFKKPWNSLNVDTNSRALSPAKVQVSRARAWSAMSQEDAATAPWTLDKMATPGCPSPSTYCLCRLIGVFATGRCSMAPPRWRSNTFKHKPRSPRRWSPPGHLIYTFRTFTSGVITQQPFSAWYFLSSTR